MRINKYKKYAEQLKEKFAQFEADSENHYRGLLAQYKQIAGKSIEAKEVQLQNAIGRKNRQQDRVTKLRIAAKEKRLKIML